MVTMSTDSGRFPREVMSKIKLGLENGKFGKQTKLLSTELQTPNSFTPFPPFSPKKDHRENSFASFVQNGLNRLRRPTSTSQHHDLRWIWAAVGQPKSTQRNTSWKILK